jgi:hypothetical protein
MEKNIILGRNNSFISYCSIFSKDFHLLYPPQLCQIGFLSKEIFDIIIIRGLTLTIKIYLPFSSDYLDKFNNFLILSYSWFKTKILPNDKIEVNTILEKLKSNLNLWEKDYYDTLINLKNKDEIQKLFEIEILKEFIGEGCICLLKFKDCEIASYFFNRFNKSIKINEKDYLIKILSINDLSISKNNKKLELNDYFLSQINNKYGIFENETSQIKINNKNNREYLILFHSFKLISNDSKNIYYRNFKHFIKNNIIINKDNINYNINSFHIKSTNVFKYNKISITKEYNSNENLKVFNIKQIDLKKKSKSSKIDKSERTYNNTRIKSENKTQNLINGYFQKEKHEEKEEEKSNKRKREENEEEKKKPKKFTKIDQYFKLNK